MAKASRSAADLSDDLQCPADLRHVLPLRVLEELVRALGALRTGALRLVVPGDVERLEPGLGRSAESVVSEELERQQAHFGGRLIAVHVLALVEFLSLIHIS